MSSDPVKRKLGREILPYIISARRLRRRWFYITHSIFGYTTDVLVALTAIGLSSPILDFFANGEPTAGHDDSARVSLAEVLSSVPQWLYYPTIAIAVVWVLLRVAFVREDGQKRAVLARSCFTSLRQVEARLHKILVKEDPMADLMKLADEEIWPTVDRNIQERSWPWAGPAPDIEKEVEELLRNFCSRYESGWLPSQTPELRAAA